MIRFAVLAIVVCVSVECTKSNPLNCSDGTCSDPMYPFCDSTAQFQSSVFTCIAVQCTPDAFVACRSDEALSCNATGNDYNVMKCPNGCSQDASGCLACTTNADCKSPTPKCTTGGACVQCLLNVDCTSASEAICDQTTNMCRGCQSDNDCASRVCDATTGTCLDESQVLYVSNNSHTDNCIPLDPCPLASASTLVTPSRFTIKMEAGTYVNQGSAIPFSTGPTTIHAAGVTFSGQSLSASGSGDLTIIGGEFTGSAGVTCNQAKVHLSSVSVTGGNISGTVCTLTASHSQFNSSSSIGGQGCAVSVDHSLFNMSSAGASSGASLNVQNSVFNGGSVGFFNAGNATISFSTFFNTPVTCTDTIHNPPSVSISNDVHFGTGSGDVVTGCPTRYSILQPQAALVGTDHVINNVDPMFQNAAQGDFHLLVHSPAVDAADPNVSVSDDYDGTMRPQGNAADMGAFEYKP